MASASAPKAPAMLPTERLAEVLAILTVNVVEALEIRDREVVLERIANRALDQAATPGGSVAAAMLGAIGGALIRLEG